MATSDCGGLKTDYCFSFGNQVIDYLSSFFIKKRMNLTFIKPVLTSKSLLSVPQ